MDKATTETEAISLSPLKKMSKDQEKMKCRGPTLRSNSFRIVHSRYLKEPIDSCHNLCKYGRNHESNHNEEHLTFRSFTSNSIAIETVQNLRKDHSKKKIELKKVGAYDKSVGFDVLSLLSKHRRAVSSPHFILQEDPKGHIGLLAKEIGLVSNSINDVSEAYSPIHKRIKSFEDLILRNPEQNIQSQVEDDERVRIKSKNIVEFESNINVSSRILLLESKCIEISPQVIRPKLPNNEVIDVNFLNTSKNKKHVNKPKVSSTLKSTSVKSNIIKQKNSSTSIVAEEKVLSNLKESATSTTIKAIKQKNLVMRKQPPSSKLQSNNQNASPPSRKINSFATHPIRLNVSFKARILKVIQSKTNGKGLDNQEKLNKKLDAHKSSNEQSQRKYKHVTTTTTKEENKRGARKTQTSQQTVGSSSSPHKLKFKSGKLNEVTKRSLRRKKHIGDSNEHNSEDQSINLKKTNLESKADMMKHQDEHEKKKIQAFRNLMIEGTVNKHVETRKSKVKALVGVFETSFI